MSRAGRKGRSGFWRDRRGAAAVEFAVLSPVLAMLVAAAIDFGGVVFVSLRVENAVSAASNYAIVNSGRIDAANAADVAGEISAIVGLNTSAGVTNTVIVNNGASATLADGEVEAVSAGNNADSCYCPGLNDGSLMWGTGVTCGSACADGTASGKFVVIRVTQPYTPLISGYGIIRNNAISVRARVQTE